MSSSGPKNPDFHAFIFDDTPNKDPNPVQFTVDIGMDLLHRQERGLVIASPLKPIEGGVRATGPLDPQELRFSLLLWDRLSRPDNNIVSLLPTADEEFLMAAGVLTMPKIVFRSGSLSEAHALVSHKLGFIALDRREPGQWSLGRGEASVSFGPNELRSNTGLLFSLHEAIPMPDKDVPLEDILEFKRKRRPELFALRHHLERVYQTILAAPDVQQALVTELSALDLAIADQLKVSRESKLKFKLAGLSAKLDYKAWLGAVAAYTYTAQAMPVSAAILAGLAGAAAVSISTTASIERRAKTATPFEYISSFHRELF